MLSDGTLRGIKPQATTYKIAEKLHAGQHIRAVVTRKFNRVLRAELLA